MATGKKRASGSTTISKTAIEQVSSKLKNLPEKQKENLSLREAISELHESITTALSRGYSYEEVVKLLATQKVSITVASLKRYLAAARKEVTEKPRRTRRSTRSRETQLAKQAEALSTAAAPANTLNGAVPPEATETAPKKRTRTSSTRSRATAKSEAKPADTKPAAKTKTAAKAKPTSRAKTTSRSTSRSTSSRSRRRSGASE